MNSFLLITSICYTNHPILQICRDISMFKLFTSLLFTGLLFSQDNPILAQELQKMDAEDASLFSSFDKIKKKREIQEEKTTKT